MPGRPVIGPDGEARWRSYGAELGEWGLRSYDGTAVGLRGDGTAQRQGTTAGHNGRAVRRRGGAHASHGLAHAARQRFALNLPVGKLLVVAVGRLRFGNVTAGPVPPAACDPPPASCSPTRRGTGAPGHRGTGPWATGPPEGDSLAFREPGRGRPVGVPQGHRRLLRTREAGTRPRPGLVMIAVLTGAPRRPRSDRSTAPQRPFSGRPFPCCRSRCGGRPARDGGCAGSGTGNPCARAGSGRAAE
ncbi:hypothetical protein SHIRM173S_11450 [Streptomyces hirsutus]